MQAVILAAGLSKRLRPLTDTTPKCLLDVGGKNLLHRTLDNIISNGISDFIFVTGYRENMIKDYIKENFPDIRAEYITNRGYENNNNSYSLWMTRGLVKGDMLLLDSDILFEKEIITKLLKSGYDNCLAVNFTDSIDEEQVKVTIDENRVITKIGKDVDLKKAVGESIGIELFSAYFLKDLFPILDRKITLENKVNEFYELSFQEVIEKDDLRNSIYAIDVSEFKCMEIDTISDLENARKLYQDV